MLSKMQNYFLFLQSLTTISSMTGYTPWRLWLAISLRYLERVLLLSPILMAIFLTFKSPNTLHYLWLVPILLISLFVLGHQSQVIGFKVCYRWIADYRQYLLDYLRGISIVDLRRHKAASITQPLTADINLLENSLSHHLIELISCWLLLFSLLVCIAVLAPLIALLLLASIVLITLILKFWLISFRRVTAEKKKVFTDSATDLEDLLEGVSTLRTFNRLQWRVAHVKKGFLKLFKQSMAVELAGAIPTLASRFFNELLLIGALLIALSISEPELLILLVIFIYLVSDATQELCLQITMLSYGMQSVQRLQALQNLTPMSEPLKPIMPTAFGFSLEKVYYAYKKDQPSQLKNINCLIPEGKVTAIIGRSGAGKTTLLNLLARLDCPDSGKVMLGNTDLELIGSELLYGCISLVSQDTQLIQGSIRDNIMLSVTSVDPDWLNTVIQSSGCSFIQQRFNQGLDTIISEHGSSLSGGERQAIALARAILKNSSVILLDEATANMDPQLQKHVVEGIRQLCKGKTVVTVAHRLNTIIDADQVIVLKDGRVAAKGSNMELFATSQDYQELINVSPR